MFRPSFVLRLSLLLGALAAAPTAGAAQMTGPELAKARVCLACHQVDSKRVGPAWKSVAAKYAGQPDAQGRLETSIRRGSANKWGKVPMPAQTHVSEEEARQLAAWILTLNK
ncbi:c-type cytochrome [Pigmentiphaga litoralis]|uniref:c-type cytochrome n=1 Tax=Pigmentiphaga litoralis TaxID=516702 RepID=UPI003B436094